MTDTWTQRWNERYENKEFAYGEEPNQYFREQLAKFPPGSILFPAEGEGRNAVHAANMGWKATGFDISEAGKIKALQLAEKYQVDITYLVGKLESLNLGADPYDAMGLIYAHFPASIKSLYHRTLDRYLKVGGIIIFEAFSKNHIRFVLANDKVGGPKDIDSLFSMEEIQKDFPNYQFLELEEREIELHEGLYHNGVGSVIRFVAKKMHD